MCHPSLPISTKPSIITLLQAYHNAISSLSKRVELDVNVSTGATIRFDHGSKVICNDENKKYDWALLSWKNSVLVKSMHNNFQWITLLQVDQIVHENLCLSGCTELLVDPSLDLLYKCFYYTFEPGEHFEKRNHKISHTWSLLHTVNPNKCKYFHVYTMLLCNRCVVPSHAQSHPNIDVRKLISWVQKNTLV